jgi:hypothetical protein
MNPPKDQRGAALDVDFTPLREQDAATAGFDQAA